MNPSLIIPILLLRCPYSYSPTKIMFLGIDVGYSQVQRSTGVCAIRSDGKGLTSVHVRAGDTLEAIAAIIGDTIPKTIGINGPLIPDLNSFIFSPRYRVCEQNLSRGIILRRCKPGSSNSPRGIALHRQTTKIANWLRARFPLAPIVEVFPNAFLGVMADDSDFRFPILRRTKSDFFWQRTIRRNAGLDRLISSVFLTNVDQLKRRLRRIENHDERAAATCAIAAKAAARKQCLRIVGDGAFLMPPKKFIQPWAHAYF